MDTGAEPSHRCDLKPFSLLRGPFFSITSIHYIPGIKWEWGCGELGILRDQNAVFFHFLGLFSVTCVPHNCEYEAILATYQRSE